MWWALRTKLREWEYEGEYRVQASNEAQKNALEIRDEYMKIEYPQDFIESIIFGYRMRDKAREFIVDNIPYAVKFKEVVIEGSGLKVINYKEKINS